MAIFVGLAAIAFTILAFAYAGEDEGGKIDYRAEPILDAIVKGHMRPARLVVALGDPIPVIVMAALLSAIAFALGQRRLAIVAVLGPGLTGVATTLLKPVIGRTIHGDFAFPSGHTAAATALGLVAALLVLGQLRLGRVAGTALLAAAAIIAGGGMAFGLVASDIHYPTDTIGGFSTAIVAVLVTALAVDGIAGTRRRTA